jgi:hypothetical protein
MRSRKKYSSVPLVDHGCVAETLGHSLSHVFTMEGTKYYGVHLGAPMKTPFYEHDTRHLGPNFYYGEQHQKSRELIQCLALLMHALVCFKGMNL